MIVDDGLIENITIEHLVRKVAEYNIAGLSKIRQVYELANKLHANQVRESGDPYITHPLSVAYTIACLRGDTDSICGALLHDCVEDTKLTIEEIEMSFGSDVATIVDGVTKLSGLNSSTKEEERLANMRKIILSMKVDIRIILIKLADRLHNMRTLGYKKNKDKQSENGFETLDLFAPIADRLGIYRMKTELEDLGLKYAMPQKYKSTYEKVIEEESRSKLFIEEMLGKINDILDSKGYKYEVKVRTKNIYGVYKRLSTTASSLNEIHDLLAFKILVDDIDLCYSLLRPLHDAYKPVNAYFKDYICSPKKNMYQSIHTTVNGLDGKLVQMQLRTFEMDKVASLGITAHWKEHNEDAKRYLKDQVKMNLPFYKSLLEIEEYFQDDDKSFIDSVLKELLSDNIYVSDLHGDVMPLPQGSTIIDYAYAKGVEVGNHLVGALVNDQKVNIETYVLNSTDRIELIIDKANYTCKEDWVNQVQTTNARKLILANYQ